jgi:hypothetical protein
MCNWFVSDDLKNKLQLKPNVKDMKMYLCATDLLQIVIFYPSY